MEEQIKQRQESLKAEVEESIRLETERELSAQLEEKERLLQEERERYTIFLAYRSVNADMCSNIGILGFLTSQ